MEPDLLLEVEGVRLDLSNAYADLERVRNDTCRLEQSLTEERRMREETDRRHVEAMSNMEQLLDKSRMRVTNLEKELARERDQSRMRNAEFERELAREKDNAARESRRASELVRNYEASRSRVAELEKELTCKIDSAARESQRTSELVRSYEAKITSLQGEIANLKAEFDIMERRVREDSDRKHKEELLNVDQLIDKSRLRVTELEKELARERDNVARESQRTSERGRGYEAQLTSYEAQIASQQEEISNQKAELDSATSERNRLSNQILLLEEETLQLRSAEEERKLAEDDLHAALRDEENRVKLLSKEIQTLRSERDELQARLRLSDDFDTMRRKPSSFVTQQPSLRNSSFTPSTRTSSPKSLSKSKTRVDLNEPESSSGF